MKQVVQNYNSGDLCVEDVPTPICKHGGVLVRAAYSLVSAGTERMKVEQARMSLLAKAKARPDKVRQVMHSVRQVGLSETVRKVRERLDALTPLGYSMAGVIEEVGGGLDEFQVGDRVACAGEGIACHAEFVFVPRNLCVKVPDGVDLKDAAFATVGAIAMNGVRQSNVSLGDTVVVVGLGLVGLLGVQILKAAGCQVIGVDVDDAKLELARACGADAALRRDDVALEDTIRGLTDGHGADAAYIAASTASSDPMKLAGEVVRDRGTVAIVGMIKVEADWQTYYMKELSVVMSRSYGPGRYDHAYEYKGIDYPVGYVKWTERRNLQEFLRLIAAGQVQPSRLGPEIFDIDQAPDAYQQLHDAPGKHAVGLLFSYPQDAQTGRRVELITPPGGRKTSTVNVGMIGAGNFATGTLIPALKCLDAVNLKAICSARGLSARSVAGRHGFDYCASDAEELFADNDVDAVVVATRHDTHARFTAAALRAGKHVFVEKPLALSHEQLADVVAAQSESGCIVLPGFNRRFSPLSVAVHDFFVDRATPIEVVCRVNAGPLGGGSWYKDDDEGGWRIVSEGCHFVDLMQYICGAPPLKVYGAMVAGAVAGESNDNCMATLHMADGSLCSLVYVANGDPAFDKERIEVFGQGRYAVIENFRQARLCTGGKMVERLKGVGKGHKEEMTAFVEAVTRGMASPISMESAVQTTTACLRIVESMGRGTALAVDEALVEGDG